MSRLINFLQDNKKLVRIIIIFILAAIVALLVLNANTDLMPFLYMIF